MFDELYQLCKNPPSVESWNRFRARLAGEEWRNWHQCLEWLGSTLRSNKNQGMEKPYGTFGGKLAHRLLCIWLYGELPASRVVDHLCNNPLCQNPLHLNPTSTQRQNILRSNSASARNAKKTHCPQGHEYTPENIKWWRDTRKCKICYRQRFNAWRRKNRLAKRLARAKIQSSSFAKEIIMSNADLSPEAARINGTGLEPYNIRSEEGGNQSRGVFDQVRPTGITATGRKNTKARGEGFTGNRGGGSR